MMRVAWTALATALFWMVCVYNVRLATLLVPAYCFVVVLPYGISACQRRLARYRHPDDGDRAKPSSNP